MYYYILLQAGASQETGSWAAFTYWLIGIFVFLAAILGILQLIKRSKYTPEKLQEELTDFVKKSGVLDEQVIIGYVDNYFSNSLLAYDEVIRFLITSLTILGLLGTFIGLAVLIVPNFKALSSSMNNVYNVAKIQDVFSKITAGFKTAFYTSITGIIAGLICSFVYHIYRQHIKKLRAAFNSVYLPAIVKATKTENVAYDPVAFYKEIQTYFIEGLKQYEEEIIKSHNKLQAWGEGIITSHTNMVREYVEANNLKLQAVTEELRKEYTALRGIAKDNVKISTILDGVVSKLDSFSDVIRNYGSAYESLLEKIDSFAQEFGNLFSQISTVVDQVSQPSQLLTNLYTSIQEMVNNQNLIVNSNKDFMDKTHERFENLLSESGASNQAILSDLKEYLGQFISTVKTTFSQQNMGEILNLHTAQITDGLSSLKEKIEEVQDKAVTPSHVEKVQEAMSALGSSVNTIIDVTSTMNEMTGRIDLINRNLGKVFENLAEVLNG